MALIRPASVKLDYGSTQCSVSDIHFMGETAEVVLDTQFGEMTSLVMSSELQQREVKCGKRLGAVSYTHLQQAAEQKKMEKKKKKRILKKQNLM